MADRILEGAEATRKGGQWSAVQSKRTLGRGWGWGGDPGDAKLVKLEGKTGNSWGGEVAAGEETTHNSHLKTSFLARPLCTEGRETTRAKTYSQGAAPSSP